MSWARDDLAQVVLGQRLQHVDGGARQQRRSPRRKGLGGGADEGEQARLDVRQEGVLLALFEAMHLVHEDDGGRCSNPSRAAGRALDRFADLLHAAEHREMRGTGRRRHRPSAARWWSCRCRAGPRGCRNAAGRLEGHAQRTARAQQVLLADDLAQGLRPQALGQGFGWEGGMEVVVSRMRRARRRRGAIEVRRPRNVLGADHVPPAGA